MINWRDCIVPDIKAGRRVYVWVAYSKQYPYLPEAIGDTLEELAKSVGKSTAAIKSSWYRYRRGELKSTRYHRVKVGCIPDRE